MKIFLAVLAVLAIGNYASAFVIPTEDLPAVEQTRLEDVDTDGGLDIEAGAPIVRQRRLTCDLFSFSSDIVTPNHAACAAKCIATGRAGGHCEGTTCECRKDKWIPF